MSKRFIGTWKLVSHEVRSGDRVVYPFGEDPVGYIMYDNKGYMIEIHIRRYDRRYRRGKGGCS